MSAKKPKILLLNPPGKSVYLRDYYCSHASKARYYWGPFDLIVLSGILNDGFELAALDAMHERLSPCETLRRVLQVKPDVLLFLTGAVSFLEDFSLVAKIADEAPNDVKIVGTGDCLLAEGPKFFAEYSFLDAAVLSFISRDVVRWLQGEKGPFNDLSYRKSDGSVVHGKRAPQKGEFSLPLPRYDLFPIKKYRIPHGVRVPYAGVITDYGCPFRCDYCIGGELGFRLRNLDNLMEELKALKQLGIKELWIKDLTFGVNKERTERLMERMMKEAPGFSWVCLSRANALDEELLKKMKAAGCHTIQMGVESADEEILKTHAKGISVPQVKKVVALCKKIGIRILAHYILGLPGDTEESVRKTIRYAIELDTEFASFNVAMPRMGTVFRKDAIEKGLIEDDLATLDNSISQPVYETSDLSREALWRLRNEAIRRYHLRPRFILRRLFGVKSWYELTTLFREGWSLLASARK